MDEGALQSLCRKDDATQLEGSLEFFKGQQCSLEFFWILDGVNQPVLCAVFLDFLANDKYQFLFPILIEEFDVLLVSY